MNALISKYLLVLSILYHASTNLYAQELTVNYHQDFTDEQQSWGKLKGKNHHFYVEDGYYVMESTTKNGYYLPSTFTHYIDPEENWKISTSITQTSGQSDVAWSVLFGGVYEESTSYMLSIKSSGSCHLIQFDNGKFSSITPWKKTNAISPIGKPNKVEIERVSDKLHFYINDIKVLEHENLRIKGSKHGLRVGGTMTIKADYYTLACEHHQINLAPSANEPLELVNLGNQVNTKYNDVSPVISPNGKDLYYSIFNHPDDLGTQLQSDIWVTTKNENGQWNSKNQLGRPINNENHNSVEAISAGGNSLLLLGTYNADGSFGKGISISRKTNDGWGLPVTQHIKNQYNRGKSFSICWSVNEDILIMSAIRDEPITKRHDLYVSFKDGDNSWTEPMNLGPDVNTIVGEYTPFLAADNKTLYFASLGHHGYGSSDIYVTKRLDDTWTHWSKPQNLGPHINSPKWDMGFTLSASGAYAYMATSENSLGGSDIVEIKLPADSRPDPVLLIRGHIYESGTKNPLDASVRIFELLSEEEKGVLFSDPKTGYFEIILPQGVDYSFFAQKNGYYSERQNLDLKTDSLKEYTETEVDLFLAPIKKGKKIALNNIFFRQSQDIVLDRSVPELNKLHSILEENEKMKIRIEGHTDNVGDPKANIQLSRNRAFRIYNFLVMKGIDADRLTYEGYGSTQPLVPNDTEENKQKNRRVEFVITSLN